MNAIDIFVNAVRAAVVALTSALAVYDAAQAPTTPPPQYATVIIGDSRMNGDYNSLLGRSDILNLSVAGSKASDWLANWQANVAAINSSGARKVILQWGKNEVDAEKPVASTAHDIQDITVLIQTYTQAKVVVLGTLPVTAASANSSVLNTAIANLQPAIQSQVAAASPPGKYCQCYQNLVSGGALIATYTDDGTHLNAMGKAIYKSSITAAESMLP